MLNTHIMFFTYSKLRETLMWKALLCEPVVKHVWVQNLQFPWLLLVI
jgi:hypothetical protein